MTKFEKNIREAVEPVLPKTWKFAFAVAKGNRFGLECPINEYMNNSYETFRRKICKIEKATGYKNTGGGHWIGSDTYDLDFGIPTESED